jgi:hypothetical protein
MRLVGQYLLKNIFHQIQPKKNGLKKRDVAFDERRRERRAELDRIKDEMANTFRLSRFFGRIDKLLEFFGKRNFYTCMDPYFSMVQESSGIMGKELDNDNGRDGCQMLFRTLATDFWNLARGRSWGWAATYPFWQGN